MRYCIDLDGVICDEKPTFERALAKPIEGAVKHINSLKDKGHFIMIYTARGWAEYEMTKDWLESHGIPFDVLLMGKPIYDIYIDDRAIKFTGWGIL